MSRQTWACERDVPCPRCSASAGAHCVTQLGKVSREPHMARHDALDKAYRRPRRYVLKEDDPRFGMASGDTLVCVPYWLDRPEKLTVLYRESDRFDPQCNVYRYQVRPVRGTEGAVSETEVTQ